EDPRILEAWTERGSLAQATASSFRQREKVLENWCRRGCIQLVGSDAHSAEHRPPILSSAFQVLERWVGNDRADWIKRQPARILAGKEVEASFE
ncbi:MAG TPA: protein-tyrosine-phosphatase, partial [Bacillota bacterium]|nr:protein-tyrosine-phosphatase [Bacillota bacterium]